jgi:hypothetical protein
MNINLSNLSNRKKLMLSAVLVIAGMLLMFVSINTLTNEDVQQPSSNFIPSSAPATLLNAGSLYEQLEINQYEQLRKDLTNYSRNYKSVTEEIVTYRLVSDVVEEDGKLLFTVESFNKPEHSIGIVLQKMPQQRVALSFVDKKTGDSGFDQSLYSNSVKNKYISTLPYNDSKFTIEYSQDSNKFVVILYERSDATKEAALAVIRNGTKETELDSNDYDLLLPGFFEDNGFPDEGIEGD